MNSFSNIARRIAAALAIASAFTLAAAPAHAAKTVTAAKTKSVIDYLAKKDVTVTEDKADNSSPILTESNNYYQVYFSCDEAGQNCNGLQFRACYVGFAEANAEKVNALNRDYFYVKSYIDAENQACLEMAVATGKKGVSYEAMDVTYDLFVDFTESLETYFGPDTSGS